ncbi:5,6-dimethylbenzimidazole synthase [Streptosporangium saharense]|uniref:5,6-dimethylbenzimidazole synthase n=1 Tax=Streptosporangium saharense TaxID=1706840 RepID=UPI00332F61B0
MPEFYDVIFERRDVRAEFTGEAVPEEVLMRILGAAHAAPSVGLSQPWDFVVVRDQGVREAFAEHVLREREIFAATLDAERAATFATIKVDGVRESTLSVVVTYDPRRGAPAVLGRHSIADAGLYSVCLAIQNLWLAATAEDLGVGWVSFYREEFVTDLLGIPEGVRPVAWLCLGPVTHRHRVPDLERKGWRGRVPLTDLVHRDGWREQNVRQPPSLIRHTPGIEPPGGHPGHMADTGDPVPAHLRLADLLRERITSGEIQLDSPLPSEESLRRSHGLDREDVRRAIQVLSDEGLVYTGQDGKVHVSSRAEETGGG